MRELAALVAGALLAVLATGAMLGLLGTAGWLITASALAGAGLLLFNFVIATAWVRAFALARTGLRYGERLVSHRATLILLARLRIAVFTAAARMPADRRHCLERDDLLGRLGREVDRLEAVPLRLIVPTGAALATGTATVWFLGTAPAPAAATVVAVALAAVFAVTAAASLAAARAGRRRVLEQAAARARLLEILEGWPEIQLNRLTAPARTELDHMLAGTRRCAQVTDSWAAGAAGLVCLLTGAALFGTALTTLSGPDLPVATAMILVVAGLTEVFTPLADAALHTGPAAASAVRVGGVLRSARPFPTTPDPTVAVTAGTAVTIARGDLVLVTGPTGSGKTTLLETLAGLRPPGTARCSLPAGTRCLVPQQPYVFTGTVADNLTVAAPDATEAQMRDALDVVGLRGQLTPDTDAGVRGEKLSGGQARRLTLARVVLTRPALLLLDEPAAGVDAATAATMLRRLRARLPDTAIVIALHEHTAHWLPELPEHTIRLPGGSAG
ncbi:ATP-binding cassette domain-containing protein [Streptomyces sp. NPDC051554]|uniref:ATP-binding cassette domain-containing protein n=1 Tax=Streptomyces sp. NPDC051554 TaxID=3365656 RepID=UPI00379483B3